MIKVKNYRRLWGPLAILGMASTFVYWWSAKATTDSVVVIYFGRPSNVFYFVHANWSRLIVSSVWCLGTAIASLLLAGFIAVLLLCVALLSDRWIVAVERAAAALQTVPTLVIVLISLLTERGLFTALGISPAADIYCMIPVALSLVFTPLVNGIGAIAKMPVPLKALLRLWGSPALWRIGKVYIPYAAADILTGLKASSTWAVGAVLIAEGMTNGVSSSDTLGHSLIRPFSANTPGETPVAILLAASLGYIAYGIFDSAQAIAEHYIYGNALVKGNAFPLQTTSQMTVAS